MLDAFTDYPIESYGDKKGERSPIRECTILTWDRNKYCDVIVYQIDKCGDLRGTVVNFKQFYLYKSYKLEPRYSEYIQFTDEELKTLPWTKISHPYSI